MSALTPSEPSVPASASDKSTSIAVTESSTETSAPEPALPKLTPSEFRLYNKMSEGMDQFHNHFRQSWNTLYSAASNSRKPAGLSLSQMLRQGLDFCHLLEMHHTLEERHLFPILARKMPRFQKANSEHGELLRQHQMIHKGLVKLEKWLEEVKSGERDLMWNELKEVMDGFGAVLWTHLDEEVKELEAENMRKYWSPEEMRSMPM